MIPHHYHIRPANPLYVIRLMLAVSIVTACAGLNMVVEAQPSLRFAVIGDYGFAGQAELDVSNLVKGWNPDLVITTGDNNYDYGAASTIDANIGQYYHQFISPYTGSYGAGDSVNRFFPSLGNHDWLAAGAAPYLAYFTLPGNERYYDFAKGPVHFFVVDSDSSEPDGYRDTSTQAIWLENALAAAPEPWKIVYFHHPPYSSGTRHGSTLYMRWPFRQWGASVVMAGHEHDYERLVEDSLTYFVNGLGGKSLYSFGTPLAGSVIRYGTDYGAMLVDANAATIMFKFITRTGLLIDSSALSHGSSSELSVAPGWNMVSLPSIPADPRALVLFPTANSQAFSYNGSGYVTRDTLSPGVGYWLKFGSGGTIGIPGDSLLTDTVDILEGWNLVGMVAHPVPADSVVQIPPALISSPYFGFQGGYITVDTLQPGSAYWVKATQAGKIVFPQ